MPDTIAPALQRDLPRRHRMLRVGMWHVWLLLFISLSYKLKALGEGGVRPLYLAGVAFGVLVVAALLLRMQRSHRLEWQSPTEGLVAFALVLVPVYVLLQSLLYPDSFNDVVYSATSALLVYGVSLLAMATRGWAGTLRDVYAALLFYSLGNVVLVVLSIVWPGAVDGILMSPLLSGFGTRVSGMPGDPTHFGSLMSMALLLMFLLRKAAASAWNPLWVLLLLAAILATGSRNSLLSLLIGCSIAALADRRGAAALTWFLVGGAFLAALAAMVIVTVPAASEYFADLFRVDDPNAYSRFRIWSDMGDIAARLKLHDWLLGGGFLFIQDIYGSPYNAFLRVFFNHGIVVTVVVVATVLLLAACAITDEAVLRRKAVLGLLAYWLSFSMFLDTYLSEFFHFAEFAFWFAAALVTARSLRQKPGTPLPRPA